MGLFVAISAFIPAVILSVVETRRQNKENKEFALQLLANASANRLEEEK